MERLQQEKDATRRKCAICKKCNVKKVQDHTVATLKSAT